MNRDLSINQIEAGIAEVTHNLECVTEAQQQASEETKKDYAKEKQRLTKLLHKLENMRKEVE